jgi:DNA-binding MarR family transcriptional regulator
LTVLAIADHAVMTAIATSAPISLEILRSLRRIVRRVEGASSELEAAHGITAPQLLCLHALVRAKSLTQIELSREVRLSASTVVGVVDRLETKGLVTRRRDAEDRRRIYVSPTVTGLALEQAAPEPLQLQVERGLAAMSETERTVIAASLERLVHLLEAERIDAAPVLASGPIPKSPEMEGVAPPQM